MLNLDTHILIKALEGDLTKKEKNILSIDDWSISAIVIWEITKLSQLGRIELDITSPEFAIALSKIHVWPIDLDICRAIFKLDFRGDPADEIIAATSLVHNVPLLTRDRRIKKSKIVPIVK
ncbi:MAG: type II toxin-antitoxin system VapC family toxin [Nitrospirae bacterium]|nr:type II toxin-antitoxin system VapC family toxin [Nitrospirota bacterium]